MATWTTELEARVEVDEVLKGALMAALVGAFPEPKPTLVFSSGRLRARLEVEADHELEAARLAADRFAKAMEKAILELLPRAVGETPTPAAEEREQRTLSTARGRPGRLVLLSQLAPRPCGRRRDPVSSAAPGRVRLRRQRGLDQATR